MNGDRPVRHAQHVPAPYGGPPPGVELPVRVEPREPGVVGQVWDMLKRRKWTLLVSFVLVVGAAGFAVSRLPKIYASRVTILMERPATQDALPGLDMGLAAEIGTQLKLLESRRIVEPLVEELGLQVRLEDTGGTPQERLPGLSVARDAPYGAYRLTRQGDEVRLARTAPEPATAVGRFAPGQRVELPGLSFLAPAELPGDELAFQVLPFEVAVGVIRERVRPSLAADDASLIILTCMSPAPREAQAICERVSASYVALRNELQRGEAVHASEFLQEQSETVRAQLTDAEEELRRYRETHRAVDPAQQAGHDMAAAAQVRAQRDQLEATRVALAGMIATVESGRSDSEDYRKLAAFPTFIGNPMVGNILGNLVQYENQLHELQQRRTEQNPDVIALQERIGALEGQLGSMARNYEAALASQIRSLDRTIGGSQGRLASVPETEMELARLTRKRDLLSDLYTTLQQRLREAEIAKAVELADVTVIDRASLPTAPSWPDQRMALALAVVAGLLLGLGAALVQEFADTRLRRRYDVERDTGLPVLTVVPSVRSGFLVGRDTRLLGAPENGAPARALLDYYPAGGDLIVEAFRSLGADLPFLTGGGAGGDARTVVFTSAARGEGKTFSAVNFAATRALQGYRTLLIDADLRAGSAGSLLGVGEGPGLSETLTGEVELLDAIRMVTVGDHRLAVLAAGRPADDFGELLDPDRLDQILATAADNFEQVVIDTPPLNLVSDAAWLAARADAVVLVVRAGRTDRESVEVTLGRLARLGAHTVGVVLNDVKTAEAQGVYAGSGR